MADVVVYSTDPCPFCSRAKALLTQRGIEFREVTIASTDHAGRERLVAETGGYSFPQIIIDGTTVGGWTQLSALDRDGRLAEMTAEPQYP